MRILIAGIIGGILIFLWSAVAHMALPIGEMGMKTAADQDVAIAAMHGAASGGAGVYLLPGMSPEQWRDEAAREAFVGKYNSSPYAFVVYQPDGNPALQSMTPNLLKQWASHTAGALVLAWILALAPFGFGKRVLIAGALGLFAWMAVNVPYWNWYLFPIDFTFGALIEQVVGWTIAGVGIAWWLARGERR